MSDLIISLPGVPFQNLPGVNTIAALRLRSSIGLAQGTNVSVDGSSAIGDGGGNLYTWDALSVADDNGGTVVKPDDRSGLQAGRWLAVIGVPELPDFSGPGGAAQIGFLQAGSGAQLRTLEAKGRDIVSLTDFGAIGDGTLHPLSERYATLAAAQAVYPFATDLIESIDYAALQAAVNAHQTVTIPAGEFIINKTVLLGDNTCISGVGYASCLKKSAETDNYILRNEDDDGNTNIVLTNFRIDGARVTFSYVPNKDALLLTKCTGCVLDGLYIVDCLNDGIIIEYGANNIVKGCVVTGNAKVGIYFSGSERATVIGNNCYGNLLAGIGISATWYATVSGNSLDNNQSADIISGRDTRYSTFSDNSCGPGSPYSFLASAEPIGNGITPEVLHGITYPANATLYGNTGCVISGNSCASWVFLPVSYDNMIVGNIFANSIRGGVFLFGSSRNTIRNNKFVDWADGYSAIAFQSATEGGGIPPVMSPPIMCDDNTISGNDIYDSTGTRIAIGPTAGTGNTFFENRINASIVDNFYEYGEWVPTLIGDTVPGVQTYATRTGYYVRIGKLVVMQCEVFLSALDPATSGNIFITGAPYEPSIGGGDVGVSMASFNATLATDFYFVGGAMYAGQSQIALTQSSNDGLVFGNLTHDALDNEARFAFSVAYTIDDEA